MESAKFPGSPGTPLFPLSPERVNGTRPPYGGHVQQSPSLPDFGKASLAADPFSLGARSPRSPYRHSRNNSDAVVQGMIARFDNMSIKDFRANHEVAMKRVEIAREMAELESSKLREQVVTKDADAKKMREELRKLKKELEESRERERKVAKRLDVTMEAAYKSKNKDEHKLVALEKECRKLRKDAFKSSSAIVKIQEELKATRSIMKATQANLESEKLKSSKESQDAFTAQYQLIGVQEEHKKAFELVKVLEEEKDSLKRCLKEEEVARIAAEGRIALPSSADDDDDLLMGSPIKSPSKIQQNSDSEKENVMPKRAMQLKSLQQELAIERRLRERAQDQVEFMKMECQFQCCSCRIAEQSGTKYVHDEAYLAEMERIKINAPDVDYKMDLELVDPSRGDSFIESSNIAPDADDGEQLAYSPNSGTFRNPALAPSDELQPTSRLESHEEVSEEDSEPEHDQKAVEQPHIAPVDESHTILCEEVEEMDIAEELEMADVEEDDDEDEDEDEDRSESRQSLAPEPQTPAQYAIRTITTTTTIPMMFSPLPPAAKLHKPGAQPATPQTIAHLPRHEHGHDENSAPSPFFPSTALKADGTLDRERALELIRQRRGRARSVAMGQATPGKQMVEGVVRRDISAPTLKTFSRG